MDTNILEMHADFIFTVDPENRGRILVSTYRTIQHQNLE
jgi:hypothetical protein